MKRFLIIDGNYFANRCLGILNQKPNSNHLIHENEKRIFSEALKVQLIKLWEVFQPYFDNFIFVSDGNSWRKQLQFKPYYISTEAIERGETIITYKGQRQKYKDDSEIDYDVFYELYHNFIETMSGQCNNVFNIKSLEGDDLIALIVEKFKKQPEQLCIFATDKDLIQLISDNTFIFRNIKSKEHPDGSFVLHALLYLQEFKNNENPLTMLLPSYRNNFKDLMNVNIMDAYSSVYRQLNKGIELGNKFQLILTKIVCGDKSDNIFPLLRWKSKTGNINYSCTEKHLNEAIQMCCGVKTVDESAYLSILRSETDNPELFNKFLHRLFEVTKQSVNLDDIIEHYKHNKRIVLLRSDYFPQEYVEEFNNLFENKKSVFNTTMNTNDLKSILGFNETVQINDKIFEMFKNSIS